MKNIVLIGIMGCGKTTIAKLLAERLVRPIIDIDDYIVTKHQQTIAEMFAISEKYFRERETAACQEVGRYDGYIISTGGGVVLNPLNIEYLKKNGIIIYIDRPIVNILKDVQTADRPLLKEGAQKLYALDQERHQLYLNACDIHLLNDDSLDKITDKIIKLSEINNNKFLD